MKRPIKFGVSTLAIAVGLSLSAYAQNDTAADNAETADEENVLGVVYVSTQKREQAITDVPLAIEAIDQETLVNENITQTRQLFLATPKLTAASSFGQFSTVLSSRGITASTGLDPVVSTYVDDIPFVVVGNGWAPSGNFYDLQRVEVVSGPQGTLYGQGSMGGTVRVITNDPDTTEFAGSVQVGASTMADGEESYTYAGMVNLPVVEDKLGLRVSYITEEVGGFIDAPGVGTDLNDTDYEDIRGKLLFTPNDKLSIKLTGWQSKTEAEVADSIVFPVVGDPRTNPSLIAPGEVSSEITAFSANVDYDFGPFTLTNVFSVLEYDQLQNNRANGVQGFLDLDAETTTNEIRFVSNFEGPFQLIAGHYFFQGQTDSLLAVTGLPPSFGPVPLFFGADQYAATSEANSFFAEGSLELWDGQIEVIAGIRHFEDERSYIQSSDLPFTQGDGFVLVTPLLEDTFESTNPRFNISYRPNDEVMFYFNYATGYRSGVFNPFLSRTAGELAGFPGDLTAVQPDEVENFDFGTKFNLLDGRLTGEAAYYFGEWSDAQQTVTFNPALFLSTLVNQGDLDVQGLEFSITGRPTDNLSITFQGSLVDNEITSLAPTLDQFTILREGGPGTGVAEEQFSLSANYVRPVALFGNDLTLNAFANYSYQSEVSDAFGGPGSTDDTNKTNVRLALSDPGNWEAALFVDNLTDEDDIIGVAFTSFATAPRPRQIGFTFKKDF